MPTRPTPGRSLATRQATVDLIRTATLGSYGVTGFSAGARDRLLGRLGLVEPGISVRLGPTLDIDLDLTVAPGVPVAEVTRQVDSAVRHAVRQGLGREIRRLTIHVDGLRSGTVGQPPPVEPERSSQIGPADLADSGTDVA